MRIREMRFMGLQVWPPQWSSSSQTVDEKAVLKDVKVLIATDLLRVGVDQNGKPHLGMMFVEKEARDSLYRILKENIVSPLGALADLEIEIGQEVTNCNNGRTRRKFFA